MYLSREEENRNRAVSAAVSAAVFLLLLLFLILYHLVRPNPPFPEGGGGGQELALGLMMGNDVVDYSQMGQVSDVVEAREKEKIVTVKNGEEVPVTEEPEIKKNAKSVTPVKPKQETKEKTAAEKLAEKFKKNLGKTGGGIGENAEAGESGSPEGSPFGKGTGGHGTGSGGGEGEGTGPGTGGGSGGGISFGLAGRAVVQPPKLPTDMKEEGKVVVDIVVDKDGNVVEANPNGRGTTTSSPILKAKARQTALATKFNFSGKFEEQHGTITIVFSFQ
jgi:outer membrane biosynthesis protein TonB